jgi:hypothetical protein
VGEVVPFHRENVAMELFMDFTEALVESDADITAADIVEMLESMDSFIDEMYMSPDILDYLRDLYGKRV